MRKAVIDIGSNSIKMRIADVEDGKVHVLHDETEVVRLGHEMSETGIISPEKMRLAVRIVEGMIGKARKTGARVRVVGTEALRTAGNTGDFKGMIFAASGHEVGVVSGEQEAELSWLGAVDGFSLKGDAIMFDSGGGSTEFVLGSDEGVKRIVSVPVGAVSLSERFFYAKDRPITKAEVDIAIEFVKNLFTDNHIEAFRTLSSQLIGVGGGVVTMASVKHACENFMPSKLHGSTLTLRDIVRQIRMYAFLTLKERQNIIGLPASRADIILGSACIIFTALRVLQVPSCTVSINGLRHGLLLHDI